MSFIDSIVSVGRSAITFLSGNSLGSNLAKTALLAYAVNKMSSSVNADNNTGAGSSSATSARDTGVRLQVNPDPTHKIPIVYGSAWLGGIITDAADSNNNLTMTYCVTICEKTGNLMSTGAASTFTFEDIYLNGKRVVFKADGTTVAYVTDTEGNIDYSPADIVKIYCYAGSSTQPVVPVGYTAGTLSSAYSIMPGWTNTTLMSNLIFAIVQVNYDKSRGVTSVPDLKFHITNSMTQPGDCIYDYMTSERYGAGIPISEINS